MKPALVDTSFLVAIYNKSDLYHERCVHVLDGLDQPLLTCEAVIAETCHLLRQVRGAAKTVLANIEEGNIELPFQLSRSADKVKTHIEKYRDTPADFADACLIEMADEFDTGDILTLDSDFAHYRWRRNRAFHLLIPRG